MVRGLVTLLVAIAALPSASASPLRLRVTGDACEFGNLESQLTQMLGGDPVDSSAQASVRIDIANARDGVEARVSFDDGDGLVRGPRVVTAASCTDLVKSVAIVIATALPDTSSEPPARAADAPPVQPSAPIPVANPPTITLELLSTIADAGPEVGARSDSNHLDTDLYAAGAGGITSAGVDGQAIIGIRVRREFASMSAELRGDAPEQFSAERMGSIGVFRAQISVSPCLHLGAFAGCAVAGIGTIHGSGAGLTSAREAYTPLLTGGVRVTWERPVTRRLALRIHFDADALLTTTQFDVDNMKVWESPRFEAAAGLGVLAHFP